MGRGWWGNMAKNNGQPVRILVADDHETVRKGICMILSSRFGGSEYGEAANGLEAIAKAQELQPDLIVLDITMPRLGGFDAAREIRKLYPKMPNMRISVAEAGWTDFRKREHGI